MKLRDAYIVAEIDPNSGTETLVVIEFKKQIFTGFFYSLDEAIAELTVWQKAMPERKFTIVKYMRMGEVLPC